MESIKTGGYVHLVCRDKDGNLKWEHKGKNIITNAGLAAIAGLVGNTGSVTAFSYIALGTSSTAVAAGDTTLGAEITDTGLQRAAATVSRTTTTAANDTLRFAKTFTATGSKTVEEVGIFNASSSGVLLGHLLTGSKALQNTDTLTVTYDIVFADA